MTLNRVSPCGGSSTTSTAVTSAPLVPRCDQSIIASTAAGSPSKAASTDPSAAFRTHPATPRKRASRRQVSRKKTPCTRPRTTTRRRIVLERLTSRGIRSTPNRVLTQSARLVGTPDHDLALGDHHLVCRRRPGGWTGDHRSVQGEMTAVPRADDASVLQSPLMQRAAAVGAAIGQRDDRAVVPARQHHGYAVKINQRQAAGGDLVLGRRGAPPVRTVLEGRRIHADAKRVREVPTEPTRYPDGGCAHQRPRDPGGAMATAAGQPARTIGSDRDPVEDCVHEPYPALPSRGRRPVAGSRRRRWRGGQHSEPYELAGTIVITYQVEDRRRCPGSDGNRDQ